MKNLNYVINGVLAVAVLILFIMQFSGDKTATSSKTGNSIASVSPVEGFPVAYVNVDSLLLSYNFSIDLNEQIVRKQENARANLTNKARSLQSEMDNFQYKVQNNAFATRERAEQEQQRLVKKQTEFQELEEKLSRDLMEESQRMNERLRDTVLVHLREFNKTKGFHIIFSNTAGSPIFLADEMYNVTSEVIEYLNKTYSGTVAESK